MKNIKHLILTVSISCLSLSASAQWGFLEGVEAYQELVELSTEKDAHYVEGATSVLAQIYSEMSPKDFNFMMLFLLESYCYKCECPTNDF